MREHCHQYLLSRSLLSGTIIAISYEFVSSRVFRACLLTHQRAHVYPSITANAEEEVQQERTEAVVNIEKMLATMGIEPEPEPEPESEVTGQDGIAEGTPLDEWTPARVAELEKQIMAAKKA